MNTLDLHQAAAFLHMHPEEVRRRAKLGLLPGAKPGKSWIFIEDDLVDYVRSQYAVPRQALQVTPRKDTSFSSANAAIRGGSTPQGQKESPLDILLKQKLASKSKNRPAG
jgi:hypothetical protein